jgi:pantetheine-phosphate adenylyltransferase
MKIAVYAGTFDPFTKGHEHILEKALPLFDRIVIAVGVNPTKKTMFSLRERVEMLQRMVTKYQHDIVISYFENEYLVNYAQEIGAEFIIRGLRNSADFEYELSMAEINHGINPAIHTVFFMADRQYADISSSMVKGLIGPAQWENVVARYVPTDMWSTFVSFLKDNR